MKKWVAFWNILVKDIRTYYFKAPNISWGIIFPLAWTAMLFIKSGGHINSIISLLPGVMCVSILFGTTSMLAVTITFEKKNRSFDRLLLAPIPLELLMAAKTTGAIVFGVINAFVPVLIAAFVVDLTGIIWPAVIAAVFLIAVVSTFLGLFIAVSVKEIFEAQTFSNFFRFPMMFLCGFFFPIDSLPVFLKPLAYALPLTYGADLLHTAILHSGQFNLWINFIILSMYCMGLFYLSIKNIQRKWIL